MTALPEPAAIREVSGVDRAVFDAEIRAAGVPVVLRGVAADWPATRAAHAGDEAFAAYCMAFGPAHPVPIVLAKPEARGRFFYDDDLAAMNFVRRQVDLGFFFDRLINHEKPSDRPNGVALQSTVIAPLLPGFVEANVMPLLDASVDPRIWIGNRIRVAPHYDLAENIGVVVAGRRRFTLFPPDQIANLYTGPLETTPAGTPVSMVDLAAPDLDRFPRFAAAAETAQAATLDPGDAIYIPFAWWHGVDSLDPVSALINYWWNQAPTTLPQPYAALTLSIAALRSLPPEHRRAWRNLYDHYVFAEEDVAAAHLPEPAKGILGPPRADLFRRLHATLLNLFSG
jgi:hypothetical protein